MKPIRLKPGSTIGLLAPAFAMDPEKMEPAIRPLKEMGFTIREAAHLYSHTNGYAGSVQERAEDFNAMIADPEVDMLFFGGGEVSSEILPYVDFDAVRRNPKIIASFSDGTTLLEAITAKTGLVTFYGQSPRTFGEGDPYNRGCFEDCFLRGEYAYRAATPWKVIHPGKGEGLITGGYLINYAVMLQGDYFSWSRDQRYILVLEDHEMFSIPAAVSKWFSHIEQAGLFAQVDGLIFGHYAAEPVAEIDEILLRLGKKYQIPVVHHDDFGHGRFNAIYPLGIRAALDTYAKEPFRFLENGVLPE